MQDEELDKLINDAAKQHHPPYDDKAWGKMRVLLDKHLPQQKDRRKPLAVILLFLLAGSVLLLGILQPWKHTAPQPGSSSAAIQKSNTTLPSTAAAVNTTDKNSNPAGNSSLAPSGNTMPVTDAGSVATGVNPTESRTSLFADANTRSYNSKGKTIMKIKKPAAGDDAGDNEKNPDVAAAVNKAGTEEKPASSPKPGNADDNGLITAVIKEAAVTPKPNEEPPKPAENKTTASKNNPSSKENHKSSSKFADQFALTFSTGADISYIELKNTGKLKSFYGAGFSYSLGNHLKLGSGFYVSKKVYTALPYQYKFPNGVVYPNLTEINADCNVYEIPVSVYYNFNAAKKHNWFAGTGLSSYLMKKEGYNYLYKTPGGQSYSYTRTINNENKHYLSVLTLSAGYQYKLNNRFSLMAEPYLKLPLGGVGAGKVKLNSTGVMVTASFKPFAKKH